MADKKIKAVLFDLGETLINFGRVNAGQIFEKAGRCSYEYLKQAGQPVGSFCEYFWGNLFNVKVKAVFAEVVGRDFDSLEEVKKFGRKKKFDLTDNQWKELHWRWYKPLKEISTVESDLKDTLETLKCFGLKLGIISNTFVNGCALDRHLDAVGIIDYFPMRLYSCDFKYRKPSRKIFLEGSRLIGTEPENIVYVGDRIDKDVHGALKSGMIPVMKLAYTNAGKKCPDGVDVIEKISELPEIINKLNSQDLS